MSVFPDMLVSRSIRRYVHDARQALRGEKMKRQSGMSLIEVMVAVVILAAGLLGLASLQARSLVWSDSSHYRSIAADLAADLADRIRANRAPFFGIDENAALASGLAATPNFATCTQSGASVTGCPGTFRVAADMTEWNTNLRNLLPNGTFALASVSASQGYRYTLTITWTDDRGADTGKGESINASYVTVIE